MLRSVINQSVNLSLARSLSLNAINGKYAGQYRGIIWDPALKNKDAKHTRDDMGLTQHQATHVNIQDTKTKKVVAIFTSSSGKNADPLAHFEKLDATKYDGSFTPQVDPKTKQVLLDANENPIPDPKKGGQYVAVLSQERTIKKDAEHHVKEVTHVQQYLDTHESNITSIIEKGCLKKSITMPKNIGGKDDE